MAENFFLDVVKKSISSLFVKISSQIIGLFITIYIANNLGAKGMGLISLSNKFAALILIITTFGFGNVILKKISIAESRGNVEEIASTIKTAIRFNGIIASVITIIIILFIPKICDVFFNEPELVIPLSISVLMVVPQTLSRVFSAALNGMNKIWQSNLVNQALSFWFIGLSLLIVHILNYEITVNTIAIIYGISRLVVFCSVGIYWKSIFKFKGRTDNLLKEMIKMALPLLIVSSAFVITSNADIIMLGFLSSTEEVGKFTVAARLAFILSFFLYVANSAISPKIASLYAENKIKELRVLVQKMTGLLTIIAIVCFSILFFFGKKILSFWGDEFIDSYDVLITLSIGQFFNISTGCVGLLLILCGYEKDQGKISLVTLILNLVLNYFFIINFAAFGAALATAITVILMNIVKVVIVKKRLNILTIPSFKL